MLELTEVSKRYGKAQALEPTTLALPAGQTTVLIGPSGCGKSTLLRLMIGLIWPDRGRVCFDGAELSPANVLQLRRRMGYVIQDGGLFPHLTARGNATLMARHLGWDRGRRETRLTELAELTRFPADGLDRYPAQLSGGQQQRVSLMRALMLDPDLLLLDEPLGALDPMIRSDLQADLRRIFQTLGKTVVMVTHDLAEAAFFADTIVLLRDGRVVQRGTLADLEREPADAFVPRFIRAQRSVLPGPGEPPA
jgi:osmoprotectant transport system ATP-binding protein